MDSIIYVGPGRDVIGRIKTVDAHTRIFMRQIVSDSCIASGTFSFKPCIRKAEGCLTSLSDQPAVVLLSQHGAGRHCTVSSMRVEVLAKNMIAIINVAAIEWSGSVP